MAFGSVAIHVICPILQTSATLRCENYGQDFDSVLYFPDLICKKYPHICHCHRIRKISFLFASRVAIYYTLTLKAEMQASPW
jgi:hypothetical protein